MLLFLFLTLPAVRIQAILFYLYIMKMTTSYDYQHIYKTDIPYLLTSILEIKSPPSLAISARIPSLLISALTSCSSSPA